MNVFSATRVQQGKEWCERFTVSKNKASTVVFNMLKNMDGIFQKIRQKRVSVNGVRLVITEFKPSSTMSDEINETEWNNNFIFNKKDVHYNFASHFVADLQIFLP